LQEHVEALYSAHHGWLSSWLRRRLGNAFDAADIAQDTFVNVIKAGDTTAIREPRPFLATIASRLLNNRHRRQLLEAAYLSALAALPEALEPSPEEILLAVETLQQVDRMLDGLPLPVRQAFLLAHLEELTYAEIATQLQVSESSVKQYLTRANRQFFFVMQD
jgi:RNA polymerase sigma-70 factor (ECF subfamily)